MAPVLKPEIDLLVEHSAFMICFNIYQDLVSDP